MRKPWIDKTGWKPQPVKVKFDIKSLKLKYKHWNIQKNYQSEFEAVQKVMLHLNDHGDEFLPIFPQDEIKF